MRLTGLIYAAIAVAWLAYLIPTYARRHDQQTRAQIDPTKRFSASVRILRSGAAPVLDQDLAPIEDVEVSTPLTRRSAVFELRRLELQAAGRRRRVLLLLLALVTVVLGVCAAGLIGWSWLILPVGLLAGFAVVARISVRSMRRSLDARYQQICGGGDEQTVTIRRSDLHRSDLGRSDLHRSDSGRTAAAGVAESPDARPAEPTPAAGGLWDPLPITLPTYVSKPLAPRTVRTIDLSAPDPGSVRHGIPVTADGPAIAAVRAAESGPDVAHAERDDETDQVVDGRGEAATA